MALHLSTGLRTALLAAATGLKTAFANGVIELRSGPQPATADAAVSGTLLGTFTVSAGAFTAGTSTNGLNFAAPSLGVITKASGEAWQIGDAAGVAGAVTAGTVGWFRLKANAADAGALSTTLVRLDGSVATAGADLNFPNIDVVALTPMTIDTFTLTMPSQ